MFERFIKDNGLEVFMVEDTEYGVLRFKSAYGDTTAKFSIEDIRSIEVKSFYSNDRDYTYDKYVTVYTVDGSVVTFNHENHLC